MSEPEFQLRELIRHVIAELLAANDAPRAHALVLFSGALLGFEASLASLRRLAHDVDLDWTQTPAAKRVLDQEAIAAVGMTPVSESLVQSHDILILPTATVNLVAKVAHGIGDCLASNVMAEFIMSGKPVVVAVNGSCPDHADKRGWFPDMPRGYQDLLRKNLEALRSFGVRLTTAGQLDRATVSALAGTIDGTSDGDHPAPAATKAPITCTDPVVYDGVLRGVASGSVLRVGHKTVITPLARETAAARGITFEEVG